MEIIYLDCLVGPYELFQKNVSQFFLKGLVTGLCGVKKDMYNNELSQEQEDFRRSGADKLRIYGPRGLKEFLATALRLSEMKIPREYFVHELVESEEEANDLMNNSNAKLYLHSPNEPLYNTIIAPKTDSEGNKTWELFDGDKERRNKKQNKQLKDFFVEGPAYKMQAGAIRHTIPCWGYVFAEKVVDQKMTVCFAFKMCRNNVELSI
jgi:ribonuclease BN (tRNA processing enzyme)